MAIKRVSVSGLPSASRAELNNGSRLGSDTNIVNNYPQTSFLVSTKSNEPALNVSKQLSYKHLYDSLSCQLSNQFNIAKGLGSETQPIYIDSAEKFHASTTTVGGGINRNDGYGTVFAPIYLKAGVLTKADVDVGGCDYNGHTCKPIYMKSGDLRPATANIGTSTKPIYMEAGTLKQSAANVGSTARPVYMSGGAITPCTANVGFEAWHSGYQCNFAQPVYMNNGTITGMTKTIGSNTHPIYMAGGQIWPIGGNVGSSSKPIYLAGGEFCECNMATPSIGFSTYTPYQTVIFTSNGEGDDADSVSNYQGIRVVDISVYNGTSKTNVAGMVDFYIDTAGWYLIYSETNSSGKNAVLVSDNPNSWYFYNPHIQAWLPKVAWYNKSVQYCMCALVNVKAGAYIGVHPNLGSSDSTEFYVYSALNGAHDPPSTENGTVSNVPCGPNSSDKSNYTAATTSGTGSCSSPFGSKNAWKAWFRSIDFASQKWYWDNKKYWYYWLGNNKKVVFPKAAKRKLRSYYFNSSNTWSAKDTIYVVRCT